MQPEECEWDKKGEEAGWFLSIGSTLRHPPKTRTQDKSKHRIRGSVFRHCSLARNSFRMIVSVHWKWPYPLLLPFAGGWIPEEL